MTNWVEMSKNLDSFRIWPRAFMVVYGYMLWEVTEWFMTLPEPNMAQGSFVGIVWGAAAGFFGFYVNSKTE